MSTSLTTLLDHAERQRDQTLVREQRARAALDDALQRQSQLAQWRAEHRHRWTAVLREAMTAPLMQCHHAFTQRLHEAADLQDEQVERARQALARRQAETMEAERRVASIRQLLARREAAARVSATRREQRQTDEAAARAFLAARPVETALGGLE
jgi:flagellar FliJ protein